MQLPKGRPLTGDERSRLDNLYAAYNLTSDNGPADQFADCFTADGVLDLAFADRRMTGRSELIAYKDEDLRSRGDSGIVRRHINGSLYSVVGDDGAIHTACYYFLRTADPRGDGGAVSIDAGRYEDVITTAEEEYRFVSRQVTKDRADGGA